MKTVSSLKGNNKGDSPKTPGGISKSLLTPCRRVGLSRNWRKVGPSPFVSPLSGNAEVKQESTDPPRKRKQQCDEDSIVKEQTTDLTPKEAANVQDAQDSFNDNESLVKCNDIDTTPSRNVSLPQRKKAKTLISSKIDKCVMKSPKALLPANNEVGVENSEPEVKVVTTPLRTKSKSRSKKIIIVESVLESTSKDDDLKENLGNANLSTENCKQKSPENLTKECIVVIQKKIFKKDLEKVKESHVKKKDVNTVSQALFDSDSDDVPLSVINKNYVELKAQPAIVNLEDDDDFAENTKVKVKKLEDKTTSTGGLSIKSKDKRKPTKIKDSVKKIKAEFVCPESKPASQCSFDDDEDFDMDKKTILIRKSYNKVHKPMRAKSTGSITQKDIDDLKARIEMKKKLLLAKAMSEDTEELRNLIKKWQKGCQDALVELMELMKLKFTDKQNMDYSEILQTLKIPASMVGYDEENDSFSTPTDENIILSKFNDL